jgi:hypothetical protein
VSTFFGVKIAREIPPLVFVCRMGSVIIWKRKRLWCESTSKPRTVILAEDTGDGCGYVAISGFWWFLLEVNPVKKGCAEDYD